MIAKLTRTGVLVEATPAQLRAARDHFDEHDYLRLPGLIDAELLALIQRFMDAAAFKSREHGVGSELRLINHPVTGVFNVLMNDPRLFRLIGRVTGCGRIGSFIGRPYQMTARQGQSFTWHNDMTNDRMIAVSINLSPAPYRGGTLQVRKHKAELHEEIPNLGTGDAIIFRVARRLEHRVTQVVGKNPKIAFSGWFCSCPSYTEVQREMLTRSASAAANHSSGQRKTLSILSREDIVKVPREVISQSNGDSTFVTNVGTAMCFGLNQTGSRIWELIAEGQALGAISSAIADEYTAPPEEVERDVLALARELAQRSLIRIARTSPNRRRKARAV